MRRDVHGQHDGVGNRSDGECRSHTVRRHPPKMPARRRSAYAQVPRSRPLLELDLKPRDIMTREAFENAMVLVTVLGGSTNAVLHLDRDRPRLRSSLTIDDFQRVSDRVPLLART